MKSARQISLCMAAALFCGLSFAPKQWLIQARAQSTDEADLRAFVAKYIAAYQKEDLITMMSLWNRRSQDMVPTLEKLYDLLAVEDYVFSNLRVEGVKIAGNRAILHATADVSITKTATKETRQEKFARRFALVRENNQWRVFWLAPETLSVESFLSKGAEWRTSSTIPVAEQFANALLSLNEKDREALLAENREAVTIQLREELIKKAESFLRILVTQSALSAFRLAQKVAESINDKEGVAQAELGLAISNASGNPRQALPQFQKALSLFEELDDKKQMAEILEHIGTIQLQLSDYAQALTSYNRALALYQSFNDRLGVANALEEIGSVYYDQKKYQMAIEQFEKCLKIRETAGRKAEVAATHNNIGNAYYYLENYEKAIDYYQKAVSGSVANDDKLALAGALNNMGSAYYSLGNYDAALDSYQKGLKIEQEIKYKSGEATSLSGIGLVHYALGDAALALEHFHKNLAVLEFLRDKARLPDTLHNIGLAHLRRQDYPQALAAYQKALQLYQEQNSKIAAAELLLEIAGIHYLQRELEQAMQQYNSALSVFQSSGQNGGVAAALGGIAGVYFAEKLYGQALEYFQKSLSEYEFIGEKGQVAGTLNSIANVQYARGDYALTLSFADRAAQVAKQINNPNTLWHARYLAGSAYRAQVQFDQARKAFEESLAIIEMMRGELIDDEQAAPFFSDKSAPFLAMMELLLVQNRAIEAFYYAESVKAQKLWDVLRSARLRINRSVTAQEQAVQQQLSKPLVSLKRQYDREKQRKNRDESRLASFSTRLQKARQDYTVFKTRLYAAHPQLKTLRGEAPLFKAEEAVQLLDGKGALLEFIVTEAKSFLFVITKEHSATSNRPPSPALSLRAYVLSVTYAELASRVAKFREAIKGQSEQTSQIARELFDLLLRPAVAQLDGKDSLVIVPDSVLWDLPFQALQPSENRYLIEDSAIAYAPSLAALRDMTRWRAPQISRATQLLALGNPVISKETTERAKLLGQNKNFNTSPGVEGELLALSQIYGEGQSRIYTEADASEERIKSESENSSVLHLAALMLLNDASPLFSSALLAQSKEDGLLQAREILTLNLKADLVVVPVCEATQTSGSDGSGVTVLAWSWFVAGSSATVFSQWKDESGASEFVLEFHRHLKERLAPAQALRLAAIKMLKGESSHPFYWSRLIVVGAGK
jgi:tetratricopeptide (TPR) repeat protein